MATPPRAGQQPLSVAIVPWGEVIESFLEPLGLTLEDFAERMTGGWLFGYIAALQATGARAFILCQSERVCEPRRLVHAGTGASLWAVPGSRRPGARPSARAAWHWSHTPWRAFRRILRAESCNAILVQEYEFPRFDALALLGLALRIPVYATFQGGDETLSRLERVVRPGTLRLARALLVASALERQRLARVYPRLRVPVVDVPNPIDTQEWCASPRAESRAALELPPDAFVVINHGRIDMHRKGLDVLLDAWARFSSASPDSRLVVIGSGQDRDAFAAALSASPAPSILWLDRYLTDRPLLRRWLSAADVYVSTSRVEGMPVAPLEAMACGLPIVASAAQGVAEIIPDGEASGGILVPCDDASAVAAALTRLARSQSLRTQMGRAARASAQTRFSIPAVGERLARLLSSAVLTS